MNKVRLYNSLGAFAVAGCLLIPGVAGAKVNNINLKLGLNVISDNQVEYSKHVTVALSPFLVLGGAALFVVGVNNYAETRKRKK